MKVIYIEDNLTNRFLMEKTLGQCFSVDCVEDGHKGIELASSGDYDAILIDLNLNDPELDGIGVIKRLKGELGIQSYFIAITAYTGPEWEQKCRDVGFDEFLSKPVKFPKLKQLIVESAQKVQESEDGNTP